MLASPTLLDYTYFCQLAFQVFNGIYSKNKMKVIKIPSIRSVEIGVKYWRVRLEPTQVKHLLSDTF
jgi:hypothetical protein